MPSSSPPTADADLPPELQQAHPFIQDCFRHYHDALRRQRMWRGDQSIEAFLDGVAALNLERDYPTQSSLEP